MDEREGYDIVHAGLRTDAEHEVLDAGLLVVEGNVMGGDSVPKNRKIKGKGAGFKSRSQADSQDFTILPR